MKLFQAFFIEQLAKEKTIVFAYGRFNPPTTGHEKLINKVISIAEKNNTDYYIVPSHSTQPPKKNPLSFQQKYDVLQYMLNKEHIAAFSSTYIDLLKKFQQLGYTKVIQIAGSDRQSEFLALVNKYNGKPDPKTGNIDFNFRSFEVVSSGDRDPDSDSVEGMSASKLRQYAAVEDFKNFEKGMSNKVPHKVKLHVYNVIRKTL
jgi:hypothetical protein